MALETAVPITGTVELQILTLNERQLADIEEASSLQR
jgi:hypothetical protein